MDVSCERCATDYEFDDALVSERGTTVECTNCGYKFKVYPPQRRLGVEEQWVVHTVAGRELVYKSLRELQKGIARGQIGPGDQLARENQPPRPLGSIAELTAFFQGGPRVRRPRPQRTLSGVAPPAAGSAPHAAAPPPPAVPGIPPARDPRAVPPGAVVTPQRVLVAHPATAPVRRLGPGGTYAPDEAIPDTIRRAPAPAHGGGARADAEAADIPPSAPADSQPRVPDSAAAPIQQAEDERTTISKQTIKLGSAPPDVLAARAEVRRAAVVKSDATAVDSLAKTQPTEVTALGEADTLREIETPAVPEVAPHSLGSTLALPDFVPSGQVAPLIHEEPSEPFHSPVPPGASEQYEDSLSDPDPRYVSPTSSRRARSRWIAGVVLVGVLLLFAGTLGRKYVTRFAQPTPETARPTDARVAKLIEQGNRLLEDGELDAAREEFVKASVLAEQDPAVLGALAQLETVRADLVWLELRLLDPADQEEVEATHRRLGKQVGRAQSAVQAAAAVAPDDPEVLRARVDWYRLGGELKEARSLVGPLSERGSEPRNAFVLAALDLAEPSPAWSTVIERLRIAATAEGKLGRARAMLVYALARHGRYEQARSELAKLQSSEPRHPLVGRLQAFLDRFDAESEADAGAEAAAVVDPGKLGTLDTTAPDEGAPAAAAANLRSQLAAARAAVKSGDLARGEQLFRTVLARDPNNTEAMSGLADIARKRNDSSSASEMYDRVLEQNPSYIPALVARADQKWAAGDRAGAIELYQRIVDQVGTHNPYGSRAAARIAQGAGSAAPGSTSPPSVPAPAPTTAPPAPSPPSPPAPEATAAPEEPPAPEPPPGGPPVIDTTDLPELK